MAKNTATFTDLPAKNDLFGLNPYIEGLAKFIGMCSTPLTIAIQGDWGSGKTSMMETTREKLDTKIYPVWFNTWQYSQFNLDSELTVSFMREIVESIGAKGEVRKGFDKALNSIGSIARNAVTLAADRFLGEKIGAAVGNAMDCLNQSSPTYAALEVKNLRAEFEKCVNFALKARNKEKLVIFVDDLDRLNPSRAVELLEVLKNYLDCEKCVFILAVDSSVIFQGVREKYSSDITPKKAKSFFDKIIQVPFKMPIDIYDIKNYVKNALQNLSINVRSEDKLARLTNIIKLSIGNNPRSMKRLFNSYNLLELVINSIAEEKLKDDSKLILFATLCMQNKFEYMYKLLVQNQELISEELFEKLIDCKSDIFASAKDLTDDEKANFTEFFNEILSLLDSDNNGVIDENETELLKKALKYSSITSTATPSDTKGGTENSRGANKAIAEALCKQLNEHYSCEFHQTYRRGDTTNCYIVVTRAQSVEASNGRGRITPSFQIALIPIENGKIALSLYFYVLQNGGTRPGKDYDSWQEYIGGENPLENAGLQAPIKAPMDEGQYVPTLAYESFYVSAGEVKPGDITLFGAICKAFDCVRDKFEIETKLGRNL